MSLPVVFRGLADKEVHEIQAWYEARQPGLGGRFGASLDLVVHLIAEHPLACALAHREARRALVPGFPTPCSTSCFPIASGFWPACISAGGRPPFANVSHVSGA